MSSSGSELDHVVYDSFGNIVTETAASSGDRFKFGGMQYDATTGQYYDYARSYSPALGRFSSQDPAAFMSGDNNLYRYANDEPVGDVDPSGLAAMGDPTQLAPISIGLGSMAAGVGLMLTLEGTTAAQAIGGIVITFPAMAEGVAMAAAAAATTATVAATAVITVSMAGVVAAEALYAAYLAAQVLYWVGAWGMAVMEGWQLDSAKSGPLQLPLPTRSSPRCRSQGFASSSTAGTWCLPRYRVDRRPPESAPVSCAGGAGVRRCWGSDLVCSFLLAAWCSRCLNGRMPRRLRLQYPGAIYHVMARGNGRQDIVRDDDDRRRLRDHLGRAAAVCSWRRLRLRPHDQPPPPRPQDARAQPSPGHAAIPLGLRQRLGSSPPIRRPRLPGAVPYRVGGGRELPLDGDPLRPPQPGGAWMAEHPAGWPWSSYPGHAHQGQRLEWVAYDELLASWGGAFGGSDAAAAYRRFVTAGLVEPPEPPWATAHHGWILGSLAFADRVGAMIRGAAPRKLRRESRLARGHTRWSGPARWCVRHTGSRRRTWFAGVVDTRHARPWRTWPEGGRRPQTRN